MFREAYGAPYFKPLGYQKDIPKYEACVLLTKAKNKQCHLCGQVPRMPIDKGRAPASR